MAFKPWAFRHYGQRAHRTVPWCAELLQQGSAESAQTGPARTISMRPSVSGADITRSGKPRTASRLMLQSAV